MHQPYPDFVDMFGISCGCSHVHVSSQLVLPSREAVPDIRQIVFNLCKTVLELFQTFCLISKPWSQKYSVKQKFGLYFVTEIQTKIWT